MSEQFRPSEVAVESLVREGLARRILVATESWAVQEQFSPQADLVYSHLVVALGQRGRVEDAQNASYAISTYRPHLRMQALADAAKANGTDSQLWESLRRSIADTKDAAQQANYHALHIQKLGEAYLEQGEFDTALDLARSDHNQELFVSITKAMAAQNGIDDILAVAREMPQPDDGIARLAEWCMSQGELDTAYGVLYAASSVPVEIAERLARAYLSRGNRRAARQTYLEFHCTSKELALQLLPLRGVLNALHVLRPAGHNPYFNLLEPLDDALRRGDIDQALAYVQQLPESDTDQNLYYQFACGYLPIIRQLCANGQFDRARETLAMYGDEGVQAIYNLMGRATIAAIEPIDLAEWNTLISEAQRCEVPGEVLKHMYIELVGASPPVAQHGTEPLPTTGLPPAKMKLLGAYAYAVQRTEELADYPLAESALMLHGAAKAAMYDIDDDPSLTSLAFTAGVAFEKYMQNGQPSKGANLRLLRYLSEACATADQEGNLTSRLVQLMREHQGDSVGLRVLKTLIENGNQGAVALGIRMLCDPEIGSHLYTYLLRKLAVEECLDAALPEKITELARDGIPFWASRQVIQWAYAVHGIQVDAEMLEWVTEGLHLDQTASQANASLAVAEHLAAVDRTLAAAAEKFRTLDGTALLQYVCGSPERSIQYFLLHGGRTTFRAVAHYDGKQFSDALIAQLDVLEQRVEDNIDINLWRTAPDGWFGSMLRRNRPPGDVVFTTETAAPGQSLRQRLAKDVWELLRTDVPRSVASGSMSANLRPRLDRLLGGDILHVLHTAPSTIHASHFQRLRRKVHHRLAQFAEQPPSGTDASNWATLHEQARERTDDLSALLYVPALITRDPEAFVDSDTLKRIDAVADTLRSLEGNRALTLRYLDGTDDLVELARLADGASCCFNSSNTGMGQQDTDNSWRARIARDPHSFSFTVESTPPDAPLRQAVGFVFGSFGYIDDQPALIINGAYLHDTTAAAIENILNALADKFAKPMGLRYAAVSSANSHNFYAHSRTWQLMGAGHTMLRPRALDETIVSDDLHRTAKIGVNQRQYVQPRTVVWREV